MNADTKKLSGTVKARCTHLSALLLLASLGMLVSCSNPSSRSKITPTVNVTQLFQTMEVRLTQLAGTPLASTAPATTPTTTSTPAVKTQIPTSQSSPVPPTTAITVSTIDPTATANSQPTVSLACDRAAPGYPSIDVTIDDDTEFAPNKDFTKIWRLSNEGTCTWSKDYAAVWFSGEKLGDALSVPFGREVPPGESVEISVDMSSPKTAGTYQSNWKLRNAGGVLFGIGPNGDAPFWVRIIVVKSETETPTTAPTNTPTVTSTVQPTVEPSSSPTVASTLTPTLSPPIHVSGSVNLLPGETLDLDTGQKGAGEDDDLSYTETESFHLLTPVGGAVMGIYGNTPPTLEACRAAGMSAAPIAAESLSTGVYLCYSTSKGLPGWLQITGFNVNDFSIRFDFLTWAGP